MKIAGQTQYIVTVWGGQNKRSWQMGAGEKFSLVKDLSKVHDRVVVNELDTKGESK